jgi:hypothetical protein
MRIYENLFIVKPDATEEEIDGLIEQLSKMSPQPVAPLTKLINGANEDWPTGSRNSGKAFMC